MLEVDGAFHTGEVLWTGGPDHGTRARAHHRRADRSFGVAVLLPPQSREDLRPTGSRRRTPALVRLGVRDGATRNRTPRIRGASRRCRVRPRVPLWRTRNWDEAGPAPPSGVEVFPISARYFFSTTLRLTFIVGVISPFSGQVVVEDDEPS